MRRWIAFHLPKSIVYWCTLRAGSYATTGEYSNTNAAELLYMKVLERCGHWAK